MVILYRWREIDRIYVLSGSPFGHLNVLSTLFSSDLFAFSNVFSDIYWPIFIFIFPFISFYSLSVTYLQFPKTGWLYVQTFISHFILILYSLWYILLVVNFLSLISSHLFLTFNLYLQNTVFLVCIFPHRSWILATQPKVTTKTLRIIKYY